MVICDYFHFSLVTPYSHIHYRVLDQSTFRKDSVLGEKKISLHEVLSHYNGVCENLELTLVLMSDSKQVGELITLMNGLKIDMKSYPPLQPGQSVVSDHSQRSSPLGKFMMLYNSYNK